MLKDYLYTLKYFEKWLLALLFHVLSKYYLKGRDFHKQNFSRSAGPKLVFFAD